ncbi:hypothetical protein [Nocardia sp. NPDC003183]
MQRNEETNSSATGAEPRRPPDHARIDTIPLIDLIDTVEICAGMEPAGDAYGGLVPQFFRFESAMDHFYGSTSRKRQKTPVLACSCPILFDRDHYDRAVQWLDAAIVAHE